MPGAAFAALAPLSTHNVGNILVFEGDKRTVEFPHPVVPYDHRIVLLLLRATKNADTSSGKKGFIIRTMGSGQAKVRPCRPTIFRVVAASWPSGRVCVLESSGLCTTRGASFRHLTHGFEPAGFDDCSN